MITMISNMINYCVYNVCNDIIIQNTSIDRLKTHGLDICMKNTDYRQQ